MYVEYFMVREELLLCLSGRHALHLTVITCQVDGGLLILLLLGAVQGLTAVPDPIEKVNQEAWKEKHQEGKSGINEASGVMIHN